MSRKSVTSKTYAGRKSFHARRTAASKARVYAAARYAPVKYIRRPGDTELKFHDVDIDDASISAAGTILNSGSVNLIAQGVTESTRIGRKCVIKSINWRYALQFNETDGVSDATDPDIVRVIMYLDRQANGATATVTGILEADNFQSFNNLANKSRFTILHDNMVPMFTKAGGGNGTTSDWAGNTKHFSFFKKCDIPLEFDSTAGAITELRSNNIGVLVLARQGALVTLDSKLRLRFVD